MKWIDLNSDVGEGIGNEAQLMPFLSSCNIACGGHAGDERTMGTTIRVARQYNVKLGAHPGYPDKENFGRKVMDISTNDLIASIQAQLALFLKVLNEEGGELHHIKPHGALYNEIARDTDLAIVFLEAVKAFDHIPIYVPFCSKIEEEAKKRGIPIKLEAFVDRNYNADHSLVSRREGNALIQAPEEVLQHLLKMVHEKKIRSIQGLEIEIEADTFCIHGDTPRALEILTYLHRELPNHNIQIRK